MIRIAVVEDSSEQIPAISREINHFFQKTNTEFGLTVYSDPFTFLLDLSKTRFSIAIIDINLNSSSINGIETAQKVNHLSPRTQVIFITDYPEFYITAYNARHVYLIPKTEISVLLPAALEKAIHGMHAFQEHMIRISIGQTSFFLAEERIRYVEKNLRKLIICADQEYECYGKFSDFLPLTATGTIMQCHRSYLVNTSFIKSLTRTGAILFDETFIPVSATYFHTLLEALSAKQV